MASDAIIADIQTIIDRIHQQHCEQLSDDLQSAGPAPLLARSPSPALALRTPMFMPAAASTATATVSTDRPDRPNGDDRAPADSDAGATHFASEVEDTAACRRRLAALLAATQGASVSVSPPPLSGHSNVVPRHQRLQRHVERDGDEDGDGADGGYVDAGDRFGRSVNLSDLYDMKQRELEAVLSKVCGIPRGIIEVR